MNGLKGEKGEPGDASVGFSARVSVLWGRRGWEAWPQSLGSQSSPVGGF